MSDPRKTTLVLVDVQRGMLEREERGERRNNPRAVANMARLLSAFRERKTAIFHIRHASTETESLLRPERPGHQPIEAARERDGEPVLVKSVNAAFIGTDLEERLRRGGLTTLVIAGITTNHCVDTTVRMAGNLGFDARLVEDACYTFDQPGYGGGRHSAEAVHEMTLSNLDGEFAAIETTDTVLAALDKSAAA